MDRSNVGRAGLVTLVDRQMFELVMLVDLGNLCTDHDFQPEYVAGMCLWWECVCDRNMQIV